MHSMIHQNCKFLKIPLFQFRTLVGVREGGSCYSAQYEPLGNADKVEQFRAG